MTSTDDFGSDIIRCDGGETGTGSNSDRERFIKYVGEHDVAKVEEHPFREDEVSCMVLTEGHLKGRSLTPDQARQLADALTTAADSVETTDGSDTEAER